jgi:hypothetical protein
MKMTSGVWTVTAGAQGGEQRLLKAWRYTHKMCQEDLANVEGARYGFLANFISLQKEAEEFMARTLVDAHLEGKQIFARLEWRWLE